MNFEYIGSMYVNLLCDLLDMNVQYYRVCFARNCKMFYIPIVGAASVIVCASISSVATRVRTDP